MTTDDVLQRILSPEPPPFALLYRPGTASVVDVIVGESKAVPMLANIPLAADGRTGGRSEVLILIPYRQITERGFECVDDETPLVALRVHEHHRITLGEAANWIPDTDFGLWAPGFDTQDDAYARTVQRIVSTEIGQGEGSNFVLKRSYNATIPGYSPGIALTLFRRLLTAESGTYWTFVVYTGDRTLVGATPERHLTLDHGVVTMNPISGTYRYPPTGPTRDGLIEFLADRKETEELYMVVDEELKMMARICDSGGLLRGPFLKEMAALAHTEYFIEGHSRRDVRDLLHETMFAPTVIGSPLESACRVVRRHEPEGRGYYSGVIALIGEDDKGGQSLDSAILIRTADISASGALRLSVGATIVRHSDPAAEAAETTAKASGMIAALTVPGRQSAGPEIARALQARNRGIARFWREPHASRLTPDPALQGRTVLIIDNEDMFTAMIAHQLRSLGLGVTIRGIDEQWRTDDYGLTVVGPGPGDPCSLTDPRIVRLRDTTRHLIKDRQPFLSVCLSHQVLADLLGLPVVRRAQPYQGTQKKISLFGRPAVVGFYNTFQARCTTDLFDSPAGRIEVSREPNSGEVYALAGPNFRSIQFHAESILTRNGVSILRDLLVPIVADRQAA